MATADVDTDSGGQLLRPDGYWISGDAGESGDDAYEDAYEDEDGGWQWQPPGLVLASLEFAVAARMRPDRCTCSINLSSTYHNMIL